MLTRAQATVSGSFGVGLWAVATYAIRSFPSVLLDPLGKPLAFVATAPLACLCVLAIEKLARFETKDLVAGVATVCAIAMTIDGIVLYWAPAVYGETSEIVGAASSLLLWSYGVSLIFALIRVMRIESRLSKKF